MKVYRVGDQQVMGVAETAKAHLEHVQARLPNGIQLTVWEDSSRHLGERIGMMLRNATGGFVLVLVLLAFFLKLRVAFWVAMGVPVSVLGALAMMPIFEIDINIMTLFSFVMALGILVDDAIVTGENIYTHQERDPEDPMGAAIRGTQEVATPVIFGVLTTIAAFAPFALIGGQMRFMALGISGVMMIALCFSLVESKLVLPSHLGHWSGVGSEAKRRIPMAWARVQARVSARLRYVIEELYAPAVRACVEYRYLTASVGFGLFFIALALTGSGHMRTVMMAPMEADSVQAYLTMPLGTPSWQTEQAILRIEESAERLRAQLAVEQRPGEPPMFQHVMSVVGSQRGGGPPGRVVAAGRPHLGMVGAELSPSEVRSVRAGEIANRWRELTGTIPGVEELTFSGTFHHFGDPIAIELRGDDAAMLDGAADRVAEALAVYPGVYDIRDSNRDGKRELRLSILPGAEALGLSLDDVGRQVRQAFYGAEAQRIQRGRDEVKVMVRYPADERRSFADVGNMRIRLPDGTAVPFGSVASVVEDRGPSSIFRRNRYRTVTVTADVDEDTYSGEILSRMEREELPELLAEFPGVSFLFDGEEFERREAMSGFRRGFVIALLAIFALLAIPLRSYLQPLFIMIVIPFGYVGALIGHIVTGTTLSMFSLIGVMACAGVVVNDSLVLVTFLNRLRDQGMALKDAALQAGQMRFRAIMLTSLTTFAGLTPVMLDGSAQAQMVIPMAVSLGFGVLFATFFSLLLVPATIVIAGDMKQGAGQILPWLGGQGRRAGRWLGSGGPSLREP